MLVTSCKRFSLQKKPAERADLQTLMVGGVNCQRLSYSLLDLYPFSYSLPLTRTMHL